MTRAASEQVGAMVTVRSSVRVVSSPCSLHFARYCWSCPSVQSTEVTPACALPRQGDRIWSSALGERQNARASVSRGRRGFDQDLLVGNCDAPGRSARGTN